MWPKGFRNALRTTGQVAVEGTPGILRRVFQNWGGSPQRKPYVPPGGPGSRPNYDSYGRIISYTPAAAPSTTGGIAPSHPFMYQTPELRPGSDSWEPNRVLNVSRNPKSGSPAANMARQRFRRVRDMDDFTGRGRYRQMHGVDDHDDPPPPTAPVTPASEKPLALTRGGIQRYRRPLFELPGGRG